MYKLHVISELIVEAGESGFVSGVEETSGTKET